MPVEKVELTQNAYGEWVAKAFLIDGATKTAVSAEKFDAIGRAVYSAIPSIVVEVPK